MPYDLVVKGGHALAPGQSIDGKLDIGTTGRRITGMQPDISSAEARRVIEVRGSQRYVVPGLIDLHTHVAYGATTLGVGGEVLALEWGPHPWGWLPEEA